MPSRHTTRNAGLIALFIVCLLYTIITPYSKHANSTATGRAEPGSSQEDVVESPVKEAKGSLICDAYPDTGDVAIAVKTGATEARRKLPAMLNTSLSCVRDVMIFSDLEQTLNGLPIHDVISRIPAKIMEGNPDFDLYFKQKQLIAENREDEIESLTQMLAPERDWRTEGKSASWGLDKYKFVHMLEMAYELQPERNWYVFLEADTYLSWPNLKRWLAGLDPKTKLYLGNSMQKSNRPPKYFAHGGSGIVLSGAATKQLAIDRKGAASRTDEHVHQWWAGDMMLADVLNKELALQVTDAAPMFNHIDAETLEATLHDLSRPAITVHHVASNEFEELYRREKTRFFFELLLSDIYGIVPSARQLLEDFAKQSLTED